MPLHLRLPHSLRLLLPLPLLLLRSLRPKQPLLLPSLVLILQLLSLCPHQTWLLSRSQRPLLLLLPFCLLRPLLLPIPLHLLLLLCRPRLQPLLPLSLSWHLQLRQPFRNHHSLLRVLSLTMSPLSSFRLQL